MSKDFVQTANDVVTGVGLLRRGAPDTIKAFSTLSAAATASHAIDAKTKELMALAIGIAVHCDGCVAKAGLGYWRKPKGLPPYLPRKRISRSDAKGIIVGVHDRQP